MGDREEAQVSNEDATSHVFPTRGREVAVSEEELGKPAFQCQVAHKARMGKISKGHGGEMVVCCISQMCGLWYLLESRFRKHLDVYADVCVLAGNTMSTSADWTEFIPCAKKFAPGIARSPGRAAMQRSFT